MSAPRAVFWLVEQPIAINWNESHPPPMLDGLAGRGLLSQLGTEAFAIDGVKVRWVTVSSNRAIEAVRAGL